MIITYILLIAALLGVGYVILKFGTLGVLTFLNSLIKINYDLGIKEANKQNYLKAIKYFQASKRRTEVSYKYIYKSIAYCYQNLGINEQARVYFERVLTEDPSDLDSRMELGKLEDIQGNLEGYEAVLEGVLQDYPHQVKALYGKSQIQMRKGLFQEAVITLESLKRIWATDINILLDLSICYLHLGERELSLGYLNDAIKNGFQEKDAFLRRFQTVDAGFLDEEHPEEKSLN